MMSGLEVGCVCVNVCCMSSRKHTMYQYLALSSVRYKLVFVCLLLSALQPRWTVQGLIRIHSGNSWSRSLMKIDDVWTLVINKSDDLHLCQPRSVYIFHLLQFLHYWWLVDHPPACSFSSRTSALPVDISPCKHNLLFGLIILNLYSC